MSALVRRYAEDRGYPFITVRQPQHLFVANGRKLGRVAEPCDPWQASVSNEQYFGDLHYGIGATPDAAVLAAINRPDILRAIHRLGTAVDNLRDCLQK